MQITNKQIILSTLYSYIYYYLPTCSPMSSASDSDDFDTQEIDFEITPIQHEPVNIKKYISQPN